MTHLELKEWREKNNLTQPQLAALLPMKLRTLQGWESGRYELPEFVPRLLESVEREMKAPG